MDELGPQARLDLNGDPSRLYADRGGSADSWLTRWQSIILGRGVGPGPARVYWGSAEAQITRPDLEFRGRLLAQVEIDGVRTGRQTDSFATDLRQAANGQSSSALTSPLLRAAIGASGTVAFDGPSAFSPQEDGLSSIATLTQTTPVLAADRVFAFARGAGGDEPLTSQELEF